MLIRSNNIKVTVGDICIEFRCNDYAFLQKLAVAYSAFLNSRQSDFVVEINLKNRFSTSEITTLFHNSKTFAEENRFYTEPDFIDAFVDWEKSKLILNVEKEVFAPETDYKLINHIFRGVYAGVYLKIRRTPPDAYLIHGCGIVDGNKCYLFTGPSGSGKTTIARLSKDKQILNDEAVLLQKKNGIFSLSGTPFDGGVSDRCKDVVRLHSIFFLGHGAEVAIQLLTKREIYQRFLAQTFDMSPLFNKPGLDGLSRRVDLSAEIAENVPSYKLYFPPDSSFWKAVSSLG